MKVYVVSHIEYNYDEDGGDAYQVIDGVFTSEKDADECCNFHDNESSNKVEVISLDEKYYKRT